MKKLIILVLVLAPYLLFYSCKEPQDTITIHKILNNSDQKIGLFRFSFGSIQDSLFLQVGDIKVFEYSNRSGEGGLPFDGDSLIVTYNDTISIIHYKTENQIVNRSMLLGEFWSGGKIGEFEYRYEYVFTNEDYQEALYNQ